MNVTYANQKIQQFHMFNYLGITFDNKLNFLSHIDVLKSKLSRLAGLFLKLRNTISDQSALRSIHYSLYNSVQRFIWHINLNMCK